MPVAVVGQPEGVVAIAPHQLVRAAVDRVLVDRQLHAALGHEHHCHMSVMLSIAIVNSLSE